MADVADITQARAEIEEKLLAEAYRYELPAGVPGTCRECGEEKPRLIRGLCARCRDELGLG